MISAAVSRGDIHMHISFVRIPRCGYVERSTVFSRYVHHIHIWTGYIQPARSGFLFLRVKIFFRFQSLFVRLYLFASGQWFEWRFPAILLTHSYHTPVKRLIVHLCINTFSIFFQFQRIKIISCNHGMYRSSTSTNVNKYNKRWNELIVSPKGERHYSNLLRLSLFN